MPQENPTTRLLRRLRDGDASAEEELVPRIYDELHRLAVGYMRGNAAHTLQPTALVNEAYMRMMGGEESPEWNGRSHFVGVAAKAMRSVLVDHVRRKEATKRGPGVERVSLDAVAAAFEESVPGLVELDDALSRLARFDPEAARIVELRFFGGLSHDEAAEAVGTSERTARRLWSSARLWLKQELGG